jgi:hypothetical protein
VVVTGWSDAPIPWPCCRALHTHENGWGLLVDEELARGVDSFTLLILQPLRAQGVHPEAIDADDVRQYVECVWDLIEDNRRRASGRGSTRGWCGGRAWSWCERRIFAGGPSPLPVGYSVERQSP